MKYSIALLAASLAFAPTLHLQAQRTPPMPEQMAQREVSHYTTLLSLTTEQVEEATTIFTAAAGSEVTLRASERAAHQSIQAAIKTDDTALIQQSATSLGQISGEMAATRALAQAKFYATLTADQKAKFAELAKGHGDHGGPGGPPPAE